MHVYSHRLFLIVLLIYQAVKCTQPNLTKYLQRDYQYNMFIERYINFTNIFYKNLST